MKDLTLILMSGKDIPVPECQLEIHQPTLEEISMIGEEEYFLGAQTICISKSMISKDKNLLSEINNFQVFMTIMSEVEEQKDIIMNVLYLLFPNFSISFIPQRSILLKRRNKDEMIIIDENNFELLQSFLKHIFCFTGNHMSQQAYDPANDHAKEIADKIMRSRQRLSKEKGESGKSILTQYISSLVVCLKLPMKEILNLTLFQLYDLIERYGLFLSWDLDIRARLAGASSDKQPENWMKNIH